MLFLQSIISPLFDIWVFYKITKQKFKKADYVFILLLCFIIFLLSISEIVNYDLPLDIFEAILFFGYFYNRFKQKRVLIGSIITLELIDLILAITSNLIFIIFDPSDNGIFFIDLLLESLMFIFILKFHNIIQNLLSNKNSSIFLVTICYIYLSSIITYYFTLINQNLSEAFQVSLGLLIFQSIFALILYFGMVKTQKNILSKEKQKRQELELKLAKAKNKELSLQKSKLLSEYEQIKEYASYLDKNEDDLRRFKHDYQNILNSLKVSAQKDNSKKLIEQLDKYTNTQFNQKALRKYKGLNHVHIDELKSIAIAKLSKLYNMNINYSFGCNSEITHIPNTVDLIAVTRIIGIAFDNAAEESQELIKEKNDPNAAKVSAMYYQENDDFEFEIKNRVRQKDLNINQIEQKNYTTKKHHMGLGLANVKEIAKNYEDSLIINYEVRNGWFTFSMLILPTIMEEK